MNGILLGDGDPPWSNDPNERFAFDHNFDEFGDYTHRAIKTLNILPLPPFPTIRANQHVVNNETTDYEKLRPYFGCINVDTVQKTMEQSTQWGVSIHNTFPMRKYLKSRNPAHKIHRKHEPVAMVPSFLTPLL